MELFIKKTQDVLECIGNTTNMLPAFSCPTNHMCTLLLREPTACHSKVTASYVPTEPPD